MRDGQEGLRDSVEGSCIRAGRDFSLRKIQRLFCDNSERIQVMQRFFVDPAQVEEQEHRIHIYGTDVNHIRNVLRMREGEELWVSDGAEKEYCCVIEALSQEEVLLHIRYAQEPRYELPCRLYLFQGLPKADKMEFIIQKAVELGVYEIVPVETRRCVVKLEGAKAAKKTARWQQISESAAKQSRRMLVPKVEAVQSFSQALKLAEELDVCLIPYELARGMGETRQILAGIRPGQSVGIFIGPEGGFEEQEVARAVEAGAAPITLGRRILRTETAGMAVLSVLMFQLEEE